MSALDSPVQPNKNPKPPSSPVKDIDTILVLTKPFGRYQFLIAAIYCYDYLQVVINLLFMGFGGIKPTWTCSDPQAHNGTGVDVNSSSQNCDVYNHCDKDKLAFHADFRSIAVEWSLVCNREYYVSLITTIQMVGLLVGALIMGPLSDMFGRKWLFFGVLCVEYLLGALSALSPSAEVFAAFRFLIGLCIGANSVVGWVFTAEATINRYRLLVRVMAAVFVAHWNQVLIAYLTQSWKWYSIVGNLEGIPVLPILALFTHESPRWLAQKGRIDEAMDVLRKIAKFNKTENAFPENVQLETESNQNAKTYQFWELFKSKRLTVYSLVCIGTWFSVSLADYGMFLNIGNLPANVYVSNSILAAVYMLIIPLAFGEARYARINRKYLMVAMFTMATLCNAAICVFYSIPRGPVEDTLLTFFCIIGLLCSETVFDIAFVYSIELFPTLLRSNAGGLSNVSARVAAAIAPQLLYAGEFWPALPYVLFGCMCLFGAIIDAAFLPNTRDLRLPETVEQSKQLAEEVSGVIGEGERSESVNGGATVEGICSFDRD